MTITSPPSSYSCSLYALSLALWLLPLHYQHNWQLTQHICQLFTTDASHSLFIHHLSAVLSHSLRLYLRYSATSISDWSTRNNHQNDKTKQLSFGKLIWWYTPYSHKYILIQYLYPLATLADYYLILPAICWSHPTYSLSDSKVFW